MGDSSELQPSARYAAMLACEGRPAKIEVLSPDDTHWRVLAYRGRTENGADWENPETGSVGWTAFTTWDGKQLIRSHVGEVCRG